MYKSVLSVFCIPMKNRVVKYTNQKINTAHGVWDPTCMTGVFA